MACLVAGMALVVTVLLTAWWPVLVLAGLVAGVGHGVAFARGLRTLAEHTPGGERAAVTSTYFAVVYVGMSVPIVVEGLASQAVGVVPAGIGFAVVVAVAVLAAGAGAPSPGPRGG